MVDSLPRACYIGNREAGRVLASKVGPERRHASLFGGRSHVAVRCSLHVTESVASPTAPCSAVDENRAAGAPPPRAVGVPRAALDARCGIGRHQLRQRRRRLGGLRHQRCHCPGIRAATTFGNGGETVTTVSVAAGSIDAVGTTVAIQPDGKIIVGGNGFGGQDFVLARYNSDGTLDSTFGVAGIVTTQAGNCQQIALQPNGKILAAGGIGGSDVVARYNADGSLDTAFGNGGIASVSVGSSGAAGAFGIALSFL